MSFVLLALGILVFWDTVREPGRRREAEAGAVFTAAGSGDASAAARRLVRGIGLFGAALLLLGAFAAATADLGNAASGAPAMGFGLFLLACGIGGAPRAADVHFGRTEVQVGLRRIPYGAFHRFEVEEKGGVRLVGQRVAVGGRVSPEDVRRLRAFLEDRVVTAPLAPATDSRETSTESTEPLGPAQPEDRT